MVLALKTRNKQKRIYERFGEIVFNAGKAPKIEELEKAIKDKVKIAEDVKIRLMKYVHYDFQWI